RDGIGSAPCCASTAKRRPRCTSVPGSVRGHGEVEPGGLGGDSSVHEARHREGRLPREGRRFLPGSESVLVPFLEFPDESDQVSADVPVASTLEHDAGAHELTADSDDAFLAESAGRLLDPVNRGFRAGYPVANRAAGGPEVL